MGVSGLARNLVSRAGWGPAVPGGTNGTEALHDTVVAFLVAPP